MLNRTLTVSFWSNKSTALSNTQRKDKKRMHLTLLSQHPASCRLTLSAVCRRRQQVGGSDAPQQPGLVLTYLHNSDTRHF